MFIVVALTVFLILSSLPATIEVGWAVALASTIWLWLTRTEILGIPRMLVKVLIFPTLLILTSLHGLYNHPLRDAFRDIYYLTGPIVYISFGYFIFERLREWQKLLQPYIVAGFFVAVYSLVVIVKNLPLLLLTDSAYDWRAKSGLGAPLCIIPIFLLLSMGQLHFARKGLERYRIVRVLLYVSLTLATALSLSRTLIILLAVDFLIVLKPVQMIRRLSALKLFVVAFVLACTGIGIAIAAKAAPSIADSFIAKIEHSGSEVSIHQYDTFAEINADWRGFEAYRAVHTWRLYNDAEKIFGGGLGATVDLGFAMYIFDSQYLPSTHNGYAFVLIKSGILGLLWYALFILQILITGLRHWRFGNKQDRFIGYLMVWSVIVFALTQEVITGIYNKGALAPSLILLGAAFASYASRLRENGAAKPPKLSGQLMEVAS